MGYVFAAFGLILMIATGGQLVNEFLIHNLWNVWGLVAAFVMALGLYAGGRWLIKQADQWILGPRYARDTVFFPEPEERLVSGP